MKQTYQLAFARGYIAHPYWPELERLINIEKESGTRRARSEANRTKALTQYLTKIDMTVADLEKLRTRANRPFYTVADQPPVNGHDAREIIIPPHQVYGCLVQAADVAPAATRIANPDQVRSVLTIDEPVYTSKTAGDGVWERFAVVTSGSGAKLSNQRALRSNVYLAAFSAPLSVEFDDSLVDPKKVREFLAYAGREVGIGASRKLGWGRFTVD